MRKSAVVLVVLVVLVALVAAVMSPAAFAENGSFETGDFSGWAVDVPSVDAAVMPGGAPGGGSYFGAVGAGSQEQCTPSRRAARSRPVTPSARRHSSLQRRERRREVLLRRRGPSRGAARRECGRHDLHRKRLRLARSEHRPMERRSGVRLTRRGLYGGGVGQERRRLRRREPGVARRCRGPHAAGGVLRRRRQHRHRWGEAHGGLVPQPPGRPAGQGSELRRVRHSRGWSRASA